MMKKTRMGFMESSPSSSLPLGEDARARFKHQALLQDYEELLRETEAKKMKLQKITKKKHKLTAEVKFLRRKFQSFTRNPSQETPCRVKKLPRKISSTSVRFAAQPQLLPITNGDLPLQVAMNQRVKEVETPTSTSALIDLNKNAEEMEGIQAEWEPPKVDKPKRCSIDGAAVARDLNLSMFKDVGNGSTQVGKRKISWQDQVALRV